MSVIEQIHGDHEELARVLKRHVGIRNIVEDLYPDTAHFIYELLQNAEDAGASKAAFILRKDALTFEHDGRPFNASDIRGITDIGDGTKAGTEDQIGHFGIGFKAVFSYTETPQIWSLNYAFEISEMVLPSEIKLNPDLDKITRFKFPFNSDKKPREQAFLEIREGLKDIADNTLLFLSNIEEIRWSVDCGEQCHLLRIQHSDYHIEILRETGTKSTESAHFLRFTEPVSGLENQHIAIAFELEPLSEHRQMNALTSLAKQFRIVPADSGCVAIYFTAAKETSNLRFHLHAPFVPELSRSSIKNTPLNEPLFRQIAQLVAQSLMDIRDFDLLDREFLSVLPNSQDDIPTQYIPIRDAIIDAMNKKPLTPTHAGGHAPGSQLLQSEAGLKDILNRDDIRFLIDNDDDRYDWAVAATQRNNLVDRFMRDLDIQQWGVKQFLEVLENCCSNRHRFCYSTYTWRQSPDEQFLDWMRQKPAEWYRRLYTLFYRELEDNLHQFDDICIVRCSDGELGTGSGCYFPTPETREDPIHPRVAESTYTDSKTGTEKKYAKEFLEGIGVREIGEFEQIEAILERRYTDPDRPPSWETHESDLKRFIKLTEKDEHAVNLFRKYFILQRADNSWSCPSGLYLDSPYLETGLEIYYNRLGSKSEHVALSENYQTFEILEQFIYFAKKCGVVDRLEIKMVGISDNPEEEYLRRAQGARFTSTGINRDFVIPELETLFEEPTVELSCLIWKTLCEQLQDKSILNATFQYNQSNQSHSADSQLVHQLRNVAWIPQQDNESIQFVRPEKALRDRLPDNFSFAPNWAWLEAIHFGVGKHTKQQKIAIELGFSDENALHDARRFVNLPSDIREKILTEHETPKDLPTNEPTNPIRRAEVVQREAQKAPERTSEKRCRLVSINRDLVKREKTIPYLQDLYTHDDVTICQACRDNLPFKLSNGSYYFEAVEFLPDLKKYHYQNYLILCPNHAAMFMYANNSKEKIKDMFLAMEGNDLVLTLAEQTVALYFTKSHLADLKAIIEVEDAM